MTIYLCAGRILELSAGMQRKEGTNCAQANYRASSTIETRGKWDLRNSIVHYILVSCTYTACHLLRERVVGVPLRTPAI